MNFPADLRYTKTHEWVRRNGNQVTVGVTDYAQKEISDVVFVELPKVGEAGEPEKAVAVVESVKAAFDIYSPVSGKVTQVNKDVESDPGLVNGDCYGGGWLFQMEMRDPSQWDALMNLEDYEKIIRQASS